MVLKFLMDMYFVPSGGCDIMLSTLVIDGQLNTILIDGLMALIA